MNEIPADRPLPEIVSAAQQGDARAWTELVTRFEDTAVALAVGSSGRWDGGEDIAQEAFELAFRHLGDLTDPRAFPGWFRQVVRTAASRRARRPWPLPLEHPDDTGGRVDEVLDQVVAMQDAARLRTAVEELPEKERTVVALHEFAGLTYPQVAAFLGVSPSAAKKRAWSARRRLEETLPTMSDILGASRPSRTGRLRDTVLLFHAIREGDVANLRSLLARRPDLVHAREDWTPEEGLAVGLGFNGRGSPLGRAAATGRVDLCELLLDAGAPVDDACGCETGETPLWVATLTGHEAVVRRLLAAGADPDAANAVGTTPLHAAVQHGSGHLVDLLVAAGADPTRVDANGRTPMDWEQPIPVSGGQRRSDDDGQRRSDEAVLVTGVRAIDLFAPVRRGGLQHWPPAYGLGQFVAMMSLAGALRPAELWLTGFVHGPYDAIHAAIGAEEAGLPVTIRVVPAGEPPARRDRFAASLAELAAAPGDKVVVCLRAPGHHHDVAAALPALVGRRSVLATFVVDPWTTDGDPPRPADLPEGFDGRVTFDVSRALRGLWPAVDPRTTTSCWWPDDRHRDLADRARTVLRDHQAADPDLSRTEPATSADVAAHELLALLAHPLAIWAPFTAEPGEPMTRTDLLDRVERALARG